MNKKLLTSVVASGLLLCNVSNKAKASERSTYPTPSTIEISIGHQQVSKGNATVSVPQQKIIIKQAPRVVVIKSAPTTPIRIVKKRAQGTIIIQKDQRGVVITEQTIPSNQKTR